MRKFAARNKMIIFVFPDRKSHTDFDRKTDQGDYWYVERGKIHCLLDESSTALHKIATEQFNAIKF